MRYRDPSKCELRHALKPCTGKAVRKTAYGCEKSLTGKHSAYRTFGLNSLKSACIYCDRIVIRSSPRSAQWGIAP